MKKDIRLAIALAAAPHHNMLYNICVMYAATYMVDMTEAVLNYNLLSTRKKKKLRAQMTS